MKIKTVGELKQFLETLPDDTLIVVYNDDMERSGFMNNAGFNTCKMVSETKETWDRFDYTHYKYEVMVESEDGVPCLKIY